MSETVAPTVACPTCNGPLSGEVKDWVCQVGHRFSFPELAADQAEAVVRSLWYALRALEDRAIASEYVAADYERENHIKQAERLRSQRVEDLAIADRLHDLLKSVDTIDRRSQRHSDAISHDETQGHGSHT